MCHQKKKSAIKKIQGFFLVGLLTVMNVSEQKLQKLQFSIQTELIPSVVEKNKQTFGLLHFLNITATAATTDLVRF